MHIYYRALPCADCIEQGSIQTAAVCGNLSSDNIKFSPKRFEKNTSFKYFFYFPLQMLTSSPFPSSTGTGSNNSMEVIGQRFRGLGVPRVKLLSSELTLGKVSIHRYRHIVKLIRNLLVKSVNSVSFLD